MKIFLFSVVLSGSIMLYAQTEQILVLQNERPVGRDLITGNEIYAKEYIFPERIHNTYLDTASGLLTVQLRGLTPNGKWLNNRGNLVLYDIINKSVKWTKPVFFSTSSIDQLNSVIIQSTDNKSYCLNLFNGENLWEVKNDIYFADGNKEIGIGYKFRTTTGYTNTLEGINLGTGEILWKRELNRDFGWNDIFYLNDSLLMIVASGLHAVNIRNGSGWDYNAETGQRDYSGTLAANAAGAVLGLLTGTFVISTGYDVVRDVVSNVIIDSTDIYLASKDKVSRVNKETGESVWTYPIFGDQSSKSAIFTIDSLLYMVNYGYAYMGNRQLDFGKPFITAFNKNTGDQVFFTSIEGDNIAILDFKVKNDELTLLFKDRISVYSLETGLLQLDRFFYTVESGGLFYYVGRHVYKKDNDSLLTSLVLSDTTKSYVFTNKGIILELDDEMNITGQTDYQSYYVYYLQADRLKFLAREDRAIVINEDGITIAELNISSDSFLLGNKLFDFQENSFLEIDITQISESLPSKAPPGFSYYSE